MKVSVHAITVNMAINKMSKLWILQAIIPSWEVVSNYLQDSGMIVMELTNCFLTGFEACSKGQNPRLVLSTWSRHMNISGRIVKKRRLNGGLRGMREFNWAENDQNIVCACLK